MPLLIYVVCFLFFHLCVYYLFFVLSEFSFVHLATAILMFFLKLQMISVYGYEYYIACT